MRNDKTVSSENITLSPGRKVRMRRDGRPSSNPKAGGVTMEYVILAVLIAAAVVVAVAVFSRSVWGTFVTAGDGTTLRHTKAKQGLDMRRGDRDHDAAVAEGYHDSMHE